MNCRVYFNIRKKVFSVEVNGRVVAHKDRVFLKDCRFRVGEKGRLRVRREMAKNVHAKVHGELAEDFPVDGGRRATYNPYRDETFVHVDDGSPLFKADRALLEVVDEKARIITWSDSMGSQETNDANHDSCSQVPRDTQVACLDEKAQQRDQASI